MNGQTPIRHEQEVNVMDILRYLLSNWKWYALALTVCLTLAYNNFIRAPRTYYSSIDVLIKDPSNRGDYIGMDKYNNAINSVNIANEMHMLSSKELIEKMIHNTHCDISYTIRIQLYQGEMYGRSPVIIEFLDSTKVWAASFTMHIKDNNHAVLSEFYEGSEKVKVPFGEIVNTPVGRIRMTLTSWFDDTWIDLETHVTKHPIEEMI